MYQSSNPGGSTQPADPGDGLPTDTDSLTAIRQTAIDNYRNTEQTLLILVAHAYSNYVVAAEAMGQDPEQTKQGLARLRDLIDQNSTGCFQTVRYRPSG